MRCYKYKTLCNNELVANFRHRVSNVCSADEKITISSLTFHFIFASYWFAFRFKNDSHPPNVIFPGSLMNIFKILAEPENYVLPGLSLNLKF